MSHVPDADDVRIWGGRAPFDPDPQEVMRFGMEAPILLVDRDLRLTDVLERLAGRTGRYLFAATYGWAAATCKLLIDTGSPGGMMDLHVPETGEPPTAQELVDLSSFVAAVSKDDSKDHSSRDAARRIWVALSPERACTLALNVLKLMVGVGRELGDPFVRGDER